MEKEEMKEMVKQIIDQREEILKAFIAKYKCGPEEIMQIMQQSPEGVKFCVRRRTDEEQNLGTVGHWLNAQIEACNVSQRRANISSNKVLAMLSKVKADTLREVRAEIARRTGTTEEPKAELVN